jgi:hypothetical protein
MIEMDIATLRISIDVIRNKNVEKQYQKSLEVNIFKTLSN